MNTSKRKRARGESTPAEPVSTETGGSPTADDAADAGSGRRKSGKIVKTSIPMTRAQAARLDALKLRAQILMPRARKRDVVAAALDLLETVTDAKLVALLKADRPNGA